MACNKNTYGIGHKITSKMCINITMEHTKSSTYTTQTRNSPAV